MMIDALECDGLLCHNSQPKLHESHIESGSIARSSLSTAESGGTQHLTILRLTRPDGYDADLPTSSDGSQISAHRWTK